MTEVRLKRIYDTPSPDDGTRVLVDRVWPRGVARKDAALDEWAKEVAPSPALRKWFGHDPARWEDFRRKYREELRERTEELAALQSLAGRRLTLLFAARDMAHNHAVVLKDVLEKRLGDDSRTKREPSRKARG